MVDLAPVNKDDWQSILTFEEEVISVQNMGISYIPITPKYVQVYKHLIMIGAYSNTAKPWWFLGATVSQYLFISPSATIELPIGVQVAGKQAAGLNRLTLMQFQNFNVTPFVLMIEIPYWLKHVYVEVWEYVGTTNL